MQKKEIRANGTIRIRTINEEPERTQQQYKDSCDVNTIMKRYEQTGVLTHVHAKEGRYSDLGEPKDLMDAMTRLHKAEDAFRTLPASLREKCQHQPAKFLEMLQDGSNDEELIKLGIKLPKPEKKSVENPPDKKIT